MAFVGPELSLTNMNLYLTKLVQQIAVTSALLKIQFNSVFTRKICRIECFQFSANI